MANKVYGPKLYEHKLGNRKYDFEGDIDRVIVDTQEKAEAIIKTALQDTIEDAQTPVAKGGRMRVLTGFLRSSGVSTLNALPSGVSKGDKKKTYVWDGESVGITLSKLKTGDTFYFGWTANYALIREAYDGFLETALQNWQKHINNATQKLKNK